LRPVFAFLGARKFERFFAMIFLANSAGEIEFHQLAFELQLRASSR
jgi:hypothetical protein